MVRRSASRPSRCRKVSSVARRSSVRPIYRCYSKAIAEDLSRGQDTIVTTLLKSDRELAAHFLAGLIDGDGCFNNGRVNLYVSDEETLQAVVVACLRLGTVPQVTRNQHIHNVQIVEHLDLIGRYTQRVACRDERQVGSRFFECASTVRAQRQLGHQQSGQKGLSSHRARHPRGPAEAGGRTRPAAQHPAGVGSASGARTAG
ncbi:MAG: LAGLIDADG family homing endonuclease [Thermochromatium sp.]